jgi:transcriptional regulator with XRE-family HTH domain
MLHMKLSDYLARPEIDRQAFAKDLGVHPDSLYKWERGDRIPRKAMLAKIAEQTRGAVTPSDFFDFRQAS